jgi:hypothetical protein
MKDIEKLSVRDVAGGAVVPVKVVPGASRDRVAGVLGEVLKIATSAAPEKGKANAAVAKILAHALGADARNVTLVSGPTNPRKEFRVAGMSADEVRGRLERLD